MLKKVLIIVHDRYLGGSLLQAGIDTTAIFLNSMLACIITYPHVQQRAQEELDRVIGSERAPDFADWDNLPYCKALVNEVCVGVQRQVFYRI